MATRRQASSAASESAQLAHSARPNISVLNASELSWVNVQLLQGQHGQTHACDGGTPSDLVLRANNRIVDDANIHRSSCGHDDLRLPTQ